jgi:hypothetical protein
MVKVAPGSLHSEDGFEGVDFFHTLHHYVEKESPWR